MPKLTKNTIASEVDNIGYYPPKNRNFYFSQEQQGVLTRSQAARYDAMVNASMSDISEDSSEYSDDSSVYSDESSVYSDEDLESLLSFDNDNWADIIAYGKKVKFDLDNYTDTHAQTKHTSNYAPALRDIERAPERKKLNQERSTLASELKGIQQLAAQLESSYRSQKIKCYKQSSSLGSFFRSDQPTPARMDSIAQIKSVIASVQADLSKMQIEPKSFANTDPLMAMKYQVHHLQQAILTIKGAALKEFSVIDNAYVLQTSNNSALRNVLQNTFNCANMPAQQSAEAQAAFNKFSAQSDALKTFGEQNDNVIQPTAFSA